ncbi:MAG: hypothetical protein IKS18_00705 [Lachnospiraceae bacterium]|nr:hypothetical protein [Lachnospiraceae bacterium]
MNKLLIRLCSMPLILAFLMFTVPAAAAEPEEDPVVFIEETEETQDIAESISEILTSYRDSGEDLAKLQRVKIMELRSAYEHLTMAEKVHVKGLQLLESAEAALEISYAEVDELTADPDTMAGMNYTFEIRDDRPKLSLSIRYMTDEDKDGVIDHPDLILVSPSGEENPLREHMSLISGDSMTLDIVWENSFVQLDIRSADMGLWQVKSSNVVYFSLGDYIGQEREAVFESVDSEETKAEGTVQKQVKQRSRSAAVLGALWPLIFVTVLGVAGIGAILYFSKRKKTGHILRRKVQQEDDPDDEEELSEEEYWKMQKIVEKQQVFRDDDSDDRDEDEVVRPERREEADAKDDQKEENPGYIQVEVYPSEIGGDEEDDDLTLPIREEKEEPVRNAPKPMARQFGQRTRHAS